MRGNSNKTLWKPPRRPNYDILMQPHDIMMKIHDIEILRKSCKMSTKIYENPLEYHIQVWDSHTTPAKSVKTICDWYPIPSDSCIRFKMHFISSGNSTLNYSKPLQLDYNQPSDVLSERHYQQRGSIQRTITHMVLLSSSMLRINTTRTYKPRNGNTM